MVTKNKKLQTLLKSDFILKVEELNYVSVKLSEILERGKRLDASYFDIEGKKARQIVANCKYPKIPLFDKNGFAQRVYHFPRFRRVFVEKGIPIFTSSQILNLRPTPEKFVSTKTRANLNALTLKEGQIVVTCSGSIGFCSVVTETLKDKVFSHDLIRIECNDSNEIGYVYAFLRTKIGHKILTINNYGSVVTHIEPEHLRNVAVTRLPDSFRTEIHQNVMRSFELRDEVNKLLNQADALLFKKLKMPPLENLMPQYLDNPEKLRVFSIGIKNWRKRLDSSFHLPIIDKIVQQLKKSSVELTTVGNERVSEKIILPGRFKRVYVAKDYGIPFLSSKNILQFDPVQTKYLSPIYHSKRISEQLILRENMVLITCSGTVGNVVLTPKHLEGWTASQHVLKIVPSKKINPGYIYAFLASSYGKELLKRWTYGSVVDEIDDKQLAAIEFPLPSRAVQDKIGNIVLSANRKWTEAYVLEKAAVSEVETNILSNQLG